MCDSQVSGCQMPVRLPERKAHSTFAQLNPPVTCGLSVTNPISSKLTKSCPITGPKVASVARPRSPQIKTVRRAFFARFIDAEQHCESPPSVQPASGSAGWLLQRECESRSAGVLACELARRDARRYPLAWRRGRRQTL